MKKLVWIAGLVLALCLFFIWRYFSLSPAASTFSSLSPTPTIPATLPLYTIEYKSKTYAYLYFSVSLPSELSLIPNFSERLTVSELVDTYGCANGINGGFYTTDGTPLGGFKSEGSIIKNPVTNRLIDGFVWATDKNFFITTKEPDSDARFFLQTGPLLFLGSTPTHISIANDEEKRRSVVGLTQGNTLVFFIVYNPESVYDGPYLADMPGIVRQLEDNIGVSFTAALNLDGGSASAFVSKERVLQEFSPVGSLFCVSK